MQHNSLQQSALSYRRVRADMALQHLLPIADQYYQKTLELLPQDSNVLLDLIKIRAEEELSLGDEMALNSVKVIKRADGSVGLFFGP